MLISIHTIFIPRENILFIEEWIKYHLLIGFNKIFLYDNSGSIGRAGSSDNINKYGYDFKLITKTISDKDIDNRLSALMTKYADKLVYIKWEPKDSDGNIVYGQKESIIHYIQSYGHLTEWTAFIDIDEFIFSKRSLKKNLLECEQANVGDIELHQKKFDDRFNNLDKPVIKIIDCVEGIDTSNWGAKHIIRNNCFDVNVSKEWNIHHLPKKNCYTLIANSAFLRFNHYNVNIFQFEWMRRFYRTTDEFKLNAKCYDLYDQYHKKHQLKFSAFFL